MLWLRYKNVGDPAPQSTWVLELGLWQVGEHKRSLWESLRGVIHAPVLWKRGTYRVTIGADELYKPSVFAFVENWWSADQKWLAIWASQTPPPENQYVEVAHEGGALPIEYVDDDADLPTVEFQVKARYPT